MSIEAIPAGDEYVAKLKEGITDVKDVFAAEMPSAAFFVFFSYDLVNSTLYKTLFPTDWPVVIKKFYELVEDGFQKHLSHVVLWKYVGDELLLYRRIRQRSELGDCVPKAYQVLRKTIERLHNLFPKTRSVLSVKATVWCARAHRLPSGTQDEVSRLLKLQDSDSNIVVGQQHGDGQEHLDFLGPDIDTGFRIAKFAAKGRLVVSAPLAYLLYKDRSNNKIEEHIKIVAFEPLKGVWGGRHYPILWYEEKWSEISGTFDYDEHFHNPVVGRIKRKDLEGELKDVEKIFNDVNRLTPLEHLWDYVSNLRDVPSGREVPRSATAGLFAAASVDVHCVAVCFRKDGRVLIARRPKEKRRYPDCWEFGCGQLGSDETFAECLRRSYKEDFGISLRIPDMPVPVGSYVIPDSDAHRRIPGIIFIADLEDDDVRVRRNHSEVEWVSADHFDISDSDCVPDLKGTLRKATRLRDLLL